MLSPRLVSHAIAFSFITVVLISSCGDDDPTGGGPPDTTPPAVASVTPVDNTHIDVVFDENVERTSAETTGNYVIVQAVALASGELDASGAGLAVQGAALHSDQRTMTLTTSSMSLIDYDMNISGVSDLSGNEIETTVTETFTGTNEPDVTAPELVYRSPGPGATNVPVGVQILLTFSESVSPASVLAGVTLSSDAGDVPFQLDNDADVHFALIPLAPLELSTEYTISVAGVEDAAGNTMPDATWSFTTTNTMDTTPPTVVSNSPANGATNVNVDTNLSITFSEPVNQTQLEIFSYPEIGDGTIAWSDGGRTRTFDPLEPLLDNQQYNINILPGGVVDLAGNGIVNAVTIVFSTGATLAAGRIAGTIAGDPTSDYAQDPSGGIALAIVGFEPVNTVVIAGNNTYDLRNLVDGEYMIFGILDSNGDHEIDVSFGDAFGAYGVDYDVFDDEPDSVIVAGGASVTGINFQLFDHRAVTGTVSYSGAYAAEMHDLAFGLFDVSGFDPEQEPDYGYLGTWPYDTEFYLSSLLDGYPDGSYYVGVILDANDNFLYDSGIDPVGFYGGLPPTSISVQDGSDVNGLLVVLEDPAPTASKKSVAWRTSRREAPAWLRTLTAVAKKTKW